MNDIEFLRSLIFTYDLKRLFADFRKNVRINSKNELIVKPKTRTIHSPAVPSKRKEEIKNEIKKVMDRRKFPQERDSSRKKGL